MNFTSNHPILDDTGLFDHYDIGEIELKKRKNILPPVVCLNLTNKLLYRIEFETLSS